ncbi:uncharacterized protein LOC124159203 [Ischnura elegans]|uniref:uncharacterized protein LOC124159203 n=1 Tax=Ischnura elegans TaxID=197161 RepID=UPI001ED8671A|nr:uncharacterized protein LOC124159203 [Ischnura elegans]
MPQHKPVKSLKAACLRNIAKNIDKVWCKDYQENLMDQGRFIYVDGPFDCLPVSLVNDIIDSLKKERLLHRPHLHLLITSGMERLDLSNESVDATILNLISFRCKESLKELSLANCSKMPRLPLKNVFSVLSHLEVLDLSRTGIHDDELGILGSNCPRLRELNVSLSHYVTDKGIQYLFVEESSGEKEPNFGRCKGLTHLIIQDTRVTPLGLESALRHLPYLQHLNHPKLVSVLNNMHRSDWKAGATIPQYHLRSLVADYRSGSSSPSGTSVDVSLSVAADTCPCVTEAHLLSYRYKDNPDDLLSFSKLKNLSALNMTIDDTGDENHPGKMDYFSHAVAPVLQACGRSLTVITFGEFPPGVDVGVIGICCPSLRELNLAFNRGYKNMSSRLSTFHGTPFSSLKKLNLVCMCSNLTTLHDLSRANCEMNPQDLPALDLPPVHMKSLLSSPVLESVFIRESSVLTDELLEEVLSEGQRFLNLRDMELEQCNNLTAQFFHSLLTLPGPLRSLKVWECKQVTRCDFNSFKSISRRNRWDLRIDWT